jgi:hypothetical protein
MLCHENDFMSHRLTSYSNSASLAAQPETPKVNLAALTRLGEISDTNSIMLEAFDKLNDDNDATITYMP